MVASTVLRCDDSIKYHPGNNEPGISTGERTIFFSSQYCRRQYYKPLFDVQRYQGEVQMECKNTFTFLIIDYHLQ